MADAQIINDNLYLLETSSLKNEVSPRFQCLIVILLLVKEIPLSKTVSLDENFHYLGAYNTLLFWKSTH